MTQPQVLEGKLREFVLKHFPLARKHGVKPDEKWLETGMLDSLGILDLVHFLEEEVSIHVSDDELSPENFETFAEVVKFARRKAALVLEGQENCAPDR
jgi:acyl carrier protein